MPTRRRFSLTNSDLLNNNTILKFEPCERDIIIAYYKVKNEFISCNNKLLFHQRKELHKLLTKIMESPIHEAKMRNTASCILFNRTPIERNEQGFHSPNVKYSLGLAEEMLSDLLWDFTPRSRNEEVEIILKICRFFSENFYWIENNYSFNVVILASLLLTYDDV